MGILLSLVTNGTVEELEQLGVDLDYPDDLDKRRRIPDTGLLFWKKPAKISEFLLVFVSQQLERQSNAQANGFDQEG